MISRILGIFAVVLLLVSCGGSGDKLDPPDIEYGVDMSEMGMPVVDARFTVATLPEGTDDWLLFDDVGEFLRYYQTKSDDFQVIWLPDHDTEEWVKTEDAWFVQSEEFCYSPMKWCIASFGDEQRARDAVERFGGEIYSWDNVFDHQWEAAPAPGELEGDDPSATPDDSHDHGH